MSKNGKENIVDYLHSLIVPIDSIQLDPANVREGHDLQAIADSLQKYGQRKPVVVNATDNVIEAGNGTYQAAKIILGWQYIAAGSIKDDPQTATAYAIADNRTGDLSEFNLEALNLTLKSFDAPEEIPGIDAGFLEELRISVNGNGPVKDVPPQIDKAVELQEKWGTALGQVWQLGEHRVIVGDCTDRAVVEKVIGGERAVLCHTDPPYGINASSMTMGSAQSSMPKEARLSYRQTWDDVRPNIAWVVNSAEWICVWGGNYFADILPVTNDWLCWHKKNDGLSFSEFELAWTNYGKQCRHFSHHWGAEKKEHITQKPSIVTEWAIEQCPNAQGDVFDPFLGSGTTLIVCEQLNRQCRGIEIEPKYVAVTLQRWHDLTGQQPELLTN